MYADRKAQPGGPVSQVRIRIALDIDGDDGTWVTSVPVQISGVYGICIAAGEAAAHFILNVTRDVENVAARLARREQ